MEIVWTTRGSEDPYLFRQQAAWTGVRVHRARVIAGRMLPHAAPCHELNISLAGQLVTSKISSTGRLVSTKGGAGNICLTPFGQTVEASWEAPIDNMGIMLDPDLVDQTAAENGFHKTFEFKEIYKRKDLLIQQIGLALLAESGSGSAAGRLYADSLIQSLTLHLLTNYTSADQAAPRLNGGLPGYRLRRVQEFIDAHLEEDLGLAEIAAAAELSQFHFARAFRTSTGMTPQQFVMRQRIERAKGLLVKADLSIVEVSLRSGFKNQSHFTSLFRKFTSFTPKTWRDLKLA
ncbi:MAG: AraC family transcriptional regulator [Acidobacteriota bacterium]